jgi:hypothetical protein
MKKLQSQEDSLKPMRMKAKKDMLSSLKSMMREDMHGKLKDGLKGKMKVVVASDSPEGLEEGVDQAKESLADMIKAGFLKSKGKDAESMDESSEHESEESPEMEMGEEEEESEGEMCPKCEGKGCMACGGIAKK